MNKYFFCTQKTPTGNFCMLIDDMDIVVASGFTTPKQLQDRLPKNLADATFSEKAMHEYQKFIKDYFDGNLQSLAKIKYSQAGGEFYIRIWEAMSKILPGKTYTYKELAEKAGNENAVRAAGSACAQNLIALIVPCHRVTKSDGSLGEYAYGAKIKRYLINHEAKQ